jgi:23S rRNA (cytosine1962-C5)-methyltransferase
MQPQTLGLPCKFINTCRIIRKMSRNYIKVVLKSGKDQALKRFHPWVFSGAIKKIYDEVAEGDLVAVYSNKDEFLGIGHYQIGSIAVRENT